MNVCTKQKRKNKINNRLLQNRKPIGQMQSWTTGPVDRPPSAIHGRSGCRGGSGYNLAQNLKRPILTQH